MKLFQVADRYCKESSWKILALLKICLFSIGVMVYSAKVILQVRLLQLTRMYLKVAHKLI